MIKKILSLLSKKEKIKLYIIFLMNLLTSFLELIGIASIPIFIYFILDASKSEKYFAKYSDLFSLNLPPDNIKVIIFFSIILFLIFFIKNIIILLFTLFQLKTYKKIYVNLSSKFFNKYLNLPYFNFLNYNSADIFVNLTTGLSIFRTSLQNLIDVSKEILVVLIIIMAMIYADPAAFIIILFMSFIVFCFYFFFKNSFKYKGVLAQNYRKDFYMILNNAFGLFKVSKIFSIQEKLENNFSNTLNKEQSIVVYQEFFNKIPKLFFELFSVIILLFIIIVFFSLNKDFKLLIPLLAFYAAAIVKIVPSFNSIISMLAQLKYNSAGIDDVFEKFNKFKSFNNSIFDKNSKSRLKFVDNIIIKDISFSYTKENYIFKNFSFEIKKGEFIAITGKSGSGKTTLIDILLGILVPAKGSIVVDNKINMLKNNYFLNFGYAPQENFIFDDTLKNNITFWKETVDDKQLIEIIKDVQLFEFYNGSKEGLNTLLGEKGSKLSGGQKQRLGIARTLYLKPDILVLDEATNALDSQTQSNLLNSLSRKKPDLTVIFISHNKEIIKFCDRIINLNFVN